MNNSDDKKEELKDLEGLKKQCEEYLNGWKRAKADLINYQKDEQKRLDDIVKFSNWDLVRDLVTVLDSFAALERSMEGEPRPDRLGRDLAGLLMIRSQLEDALKRRGLERILVTVGQTFDPSLHEAIGEVESDQPVGTVVEEIERGYLLGGRVIRPARVKLSKGPIKN